MLELEKEYLVELAGLDLETQSQKIKDFVIESMENLIKQLGYDKYNSDIYPYNVKTDAGKVYKICDEIIPPERFLNGLYKSGVLNFTVTAKPKVY